MNMPVSVKVAAFAVSVFSGLAWLGLTVQKLSLSEALPELAWWSAVSGGLLAGLASFTGFWVIGGGGLREADWLTCVLGWVALLNVNAAGAAVCGWVVIHAGMLPLAQAEGALAINLVLPVLLAGGCFGNPARRRPNSRLVSEGEVIQAEIQLTATEGKVAGKAGEEGMNS